MVVNALNGYLMLRNGFQFHFRHVWDCSIFDHFLDLGPPSLCRSILKCQKTHIVSNELFLHISKCWKSKQLHMLERVSVGNHDAQCLFWGGISFGKWWVSKWGLMMFERDQQLGISITFLKY